MEFIREILIFALYLLEICIFIRVIFSWVQLPRPNKFVEVIEKITDPILSPIRKLMDKSSFTNSLMIDLSPLIALLLIQGLIRVL